MQTGSRSRWAAVLALVLFLSGLWASCASADTFSPDNLALNSVNDTLRSIFRNNKTSGAAVVVAKDGQIIYQYHYGWAVKKTKEPVTDRTYFRIASVTKLVSAIHIMQLVEQGKLSLDANISDYLGYRVRNPYAKSTPVTLRMIMTHTSSLNSHGGYSNERRSLPALISAEQGSRGNWYDETPGSVYRYSNFAAGIMGSLMEAATGLNLNDSITSSLFEPLGISAAYSASLLPDPENVPDIYNESGALYATRKKNITAEWDSGVNPDFHFRTTVGSLWIRPADLCRLGIMLCDGGVLEGKTVLQPDTVAQMMAEQQGQNGITAQTPYGLCVHHETTLLSDRTLYGHQGLSEGIVCNLYYDPQTRFVFVFCTNGSSNTMDHRVVRLSRKVFAAAWNAFSGESAAD